MISSLIMLIVWIVVVAIIMGLLTYLVDNLDFIQPPFRKVARTLIVVVGVLVMILLLLDFLGVLGDGAPRITTLLGGKHALWMS